MRLVAFNRQKIKGCPQVENAGVLEQHRFGLQMALLGQGSVEGFVDHEFPAQAKSLDGLEGPAVKRGQEVLIELLTREEEEEESDPEGDGSWVANAPRCFCQRRSRMNRVRVRTVAFKRPFFRCARRGCRFVGFGELASTPEALSLNWMRLATGSKACLVVVGHDGYRPEDVRSGQSSASLRDIEFLEGLALLAERPQALGKLLPNPESSGCHEVRLCIAGLWRSFLIDERFPMLPAADSKNPHESLAFGRCVGNQLWIPLLQKAYAKAYGSYQFAFTAGWKVYLEELTGAVVEEVPVELGEELWQTLTRVQQGLLLGCGTSALPSHCSSLFAVLAVAENGDRRVRLRNPRTSSYKAVMAMLKGVPAGSSYADGSFWMSFSDFCASFSSLLLCHAASTGGSARHTRTFQGDFAAGHEGLGTRGCSLHVVAHGATELWISCLQPVPKGARLLEPCMGHATRPRR